MWQKVTSADEYSDESGDEQQPESIDEWKGVHNDGIKANLRMLLQFAHRVGKRAAEKMVQKLPVNLKAVCEKSIMRPGRRKVFCVSWDVFREMKTVMGWDIPREREDEIRKSLSGDHQSLVPVQPNNNDSRELQALEAPTASTLSASLLAPAASIDWNSASPERMTRFSEFMNQQLARAKLVGEQKMQEAAAEQRRRDQSFQLEMNKLQFEREKLEHDVKKEEKKREHELVLAEKRHAAEEKKLTIQSAAQRQREAFKEAEKVVKANKTKGALAYMLEEQLIDTLATGKTRDIQLWDLDLVAELQRAYKSKGFPPPDVVKDSAYLYNCFYEDFQRYPYLKEVVIKGRKEHICVFQGKHAMWLTAKIKEMLL